MINLFVNIKKCNHLSFLIVFNYENKGEIRNRIMKQLKQKNRILIIIALLLCLIVSLILEPVEDVEWYLVVKATYRTDELKGYYESCDIVAETKETTWQADKEWGTQNFGFYD